MDLYGVILAGGGGTRLWPLSRQHRPKPLINLLGEASMLQSTVHRLSPLIPPERLFIGVNAVHAAEVSRQVAQLPAEQIIIEPVARETGPALGLTAIHLAHHDPDALMASFHADHVVTRPEVLRRAVALAAEEAREPHRSIPRGLTFAQITLIVLVVLTWFFAVTAGSDTRRRAIRSCCFRCRTSIAKFGREQLTRRT